MKELSIKEKAKRYDEALERAKKLQKTCDSTAVNGWCEYIFPELQKSEDDMVREDILDYCYKRMNNEFPSITIYQVKSWIAWLEKQGQVKESQIPQHENKTCKENDDSLTSKDERIRKQILNYFMAQKVNEPQSVLDSWIAWLEGRGE